MKIAVPEREGQVDEHFGHAERFVVYSIGSDRKVESEESVSPGEGCGCKSGIASTLARMGVTHLVAGGMGDGAVRVLNANGIEVVRGASGDARRAAELCAGGVLKDSGAGCVGHGPGHECHRA